MRLLEERGKMVKAKLDHYIDRKVIDVQNNQFTFEGNVIIRFDSVLVPIEIKGLMLALVVENNDTGNIELMFSGGKIKRGIFSEVHIDSSLIIEKDQAYTIADPRYPDSIRSDEIEESGLPEDPSPLRVVNHPEEW